MPGARTSGFPPPAPLARGLLAGLRVAFLGLLLAALGSVQVERDRQAHWHDGPEEARLHRHFHAGPHRHPAPPEEGGGPARPEPEEPRAGSSVSLPSAACLPEAPAGGPAPGLLPRETVAAALAEPPRTRLRVGPAAPRGPPLS